MEQLSSGTKRNLTVVLNHHPQPAFHPKTQEQLTQPILTSVRISSQQPHRLGNRVFRSLLDEFVSSAFNFQSIRILPKPGIYEITRFLADFDYNAAGDTRKTVPNASYSVRTGSPLFLNASFSYWRSCLVIPPCCDSAVRAIPSVFLWRFVRDLKTA